MTPYSAARQAFIHGDGRGHRANVAGRTPRRARRAARCAPRSTGRRADRRRRARSRRGRRVFAAGRRRSCRRRASSGRPAPAAAARRRRPSRRAPRRSSSGAPRKPVDASLGARVKARRRRRSDAGIHRGRVRGGGALRQRDGLPDPGAHAPPELQEQLVDVELEARVLEPADLRGAEHLLRLDGAHPPRRAPPGRVAAALLHEERVHLHQHRAHLLLQAARRRVVGARGAEAAHRARLDARQLRERLLHGLRDGLVRLHDDERLGDVLGGARAVERGDPARVGPQDGPRVAGARDDERLAVGLEVGHDVHAEVRPAHEVPHARPPARRLQQVERLEE